MIFLFERIASEILWMQRRGSFSQCFRSQRVCLLEQLFETNDEHSEHRSRWRKEYYLQYENVISKSFHRTNADCLKMSIKTSFTIFVCFLLQVSFDELTMSCYKRKNIRNQYWFTAKLNFLFRWKIGNAADQTARKQLAKYFSVMNSIISLFAQNVCWELFHILLEYNWLIKNLSN